MSRRKPQLFLTFFLVLLIWGLGSRIVNAAEEKAESGTGREQAETQEESGKNGRPEALTEEEADAIQQETEKALMDRFDFEEIESSLDQMFPKEKLSFQEVVTAMMSGNMEQTGETFLRFLRDQIFYEFRYNRHNLVYILLIALIAAIFSNFTEAFQNKRISEISFYVLYMLLITFCLTAFQTAMEGVEGKLDSLVNFMRVLCPSYFLAVAFASGSSSSLLFYNVILFLIYLVEIVIVRFLLPVVHIYIMVRVLGNLTGEDFLSEFADLIRRCVEWIIKTMTACVIGINVVQGLLAPAIDTLKRSALTRTAESLPWIGNAMGGVTEIVLGTAVLIKNGIGMAGAVVTVAICAVPVLQMLILAFLYKLAAALVQPVSDKRITGCIGGVSEGYEMMVKIIFASGLMFLLTVAVVAASTS